MSLLISSVSAGDQSSFGTAGIANAAQGVTTTGIASSRFGTAIASFDVPSRSLALDQASAVTLPPATSVRFTFGGALIQPSLTLGDLTVFGSYTIRNLAFAAYPAGVAPPPVRAPRIAPNVPANNLVLDLTASVTSSSALNVAFTFDGAQLVSSVSLGTQTAFGAFTYKQAFGAYPTGIPSGDIPPPFIRDAAVNGGSLLLNLIDASTGLTRLDFTETLRPITGVGLSDTSSYGYPDIVNTADAVYPEGSDFARFGLSLVYAPTIRDGFVPLDLSGPLPGWPALNVPFYFNDPFGVGFDGIDSLVFGSHTIQIDALTIAPGGIASTSAVGTPATSQHAEIFPAGIPIPNGQISTTHGIGHYTRFIDLAGIGISQYAVGSPRIEFTLRYIEPPYILSYVFGSHNVARIQLVEPAGWDSSFLSENHELAINLQRVFVTSGEADPAGYGESFIRNQYQIVSPTSWIDEGITPPALYNSDQYVFVSPYMDTNSDPTEWPQYGPYVENKNRTLRPSGWQSSRFSIVGNWIWLTADAVVASGFDATVWGASTFIAYRNRTLSPEGWIGLLSSQYAVIYNGAVVLSPLSWGSSKVGTPGQVLNLNRTVKHIHPYEGETFGTAFIADRVRHIYPRIFNDIPSGLPEVRFNPYPISPIGIPPEQVGGHELFERFTVAYPPSVNVHSVPWVGEPAIINRNREVYPYQSDQALYGRPTVFNYITYVSLTAGDMSSIGSHLIRDRTHRVYPPPASAPTFSVIHQIRNDTPDPPAVQRIEAIGIAAHAVAYPTIWKATIYPEGLFDSSMGAPILTRNGIIVPSLPFTLEKVGTPALIFTRYILPKTIPWPNPGYPEIPNGSSDLNAAKPRLTPHTIYAPAATEATEQALRNHPGGTPHVIAGPSAFDGIWSLGGGWPWFGRPDVTNQHRVIGPVPDHSISNSAISPATVYGTPEVILRRRYIAPTPIRAFRSGLPVFPGVPQYVNLNTSNRGIQPLNAFGSATVAPPPEVVVPEAKPIGFEAMTMGSHNVELYIRTITLQGIPHRGNPQQDLTNPWGYPTVGYPRKYTLGGYNFTLWGNAWLSHKIRHVYPEGWDASTIGEDDLGSFADRMKISRRNPEDGVPSISNDTAFGTPHVGYFVRVVTSVGVDTLRVGTHSIKASTSIRPAGWESLEVGDIQEWEEGKIKIQGSDLSVVGIPRILNPLRPSGTQSGDIGYHRATRAVRVYGMPPIGFDGPSVSNPYGCSTRIVAPQSVLSQQYVAAPTVIQ